MQLSVQLAAALPGPAGVALVAPRRAPAQSRMTPDAALGELLAGNERFTAGRLIPFALDLSILKAKTAEKQEPFAAVLSCADLRVPDEIIFDQSVGRIFVTRVAGNVVTPEIIASLEYGVAVLGVKVILVLGHANCGAVKAAIEGKEFPRQIRVLHQDGPNIEAACKANAKVQAALLDKTSSVISSMMKEKKLRVRAGYYDIGRGSVTVLD
jgi:carbonic anhydrase